MYTMLNSFPEVRSKSLQNVIQNVLVIPISIWWIEKKTQTPVNRGWMLEDTNPKAQETITKCYLLCMFL